MYRKLICNIFIKSIKSKYGLKKFYLYLSDNNSVEKQKFRYETLFLTTSRTETINRETIKKMSYKVREKSLVWKRGEVVASRDKKGNRNEEPKKGNYEP